jgi:hypothetical protein
MKSTLKLFTRTYPIPALSRSSFRCFMTLNNHRALQLSTYTYQNHSIYTFRQFSAVTNANKEEEKYQSDPYEAILQ